MKRGKVSVGRAKISWAIDDGVRGERRGKATSSTAYPRNMVDRRISRKALAAQKSLVGCCRKRRPSIPASLAAWLAGQPVDQYCHGYDVQRGGERREEASRWRLAGWLARERTAGGGVVAHIPVTHERVENQV